MKITKSKTMTNESAGNFFEDFKLGQEIVHATPRTVTVGDVSLFTALYGPRFAVQSSDAFAQSIGYPPRRSTICSSSTSSSARPCRTSRATPSPISAMPSSAFWPRSIPATRSRPSEVIGVKENSNRKSGTVYVRSTGRNQRGEQVLSFSRWVMVNKRDPNAPAPEPVVPELRPSRSARLGAALPKLKLGGYDYALAGSPKRWGDYTSATRSTMSTARPSRRPSISSPRACSRTRRACISISISRARPVRAPARLWRPYHLDRAEP